jgi:hypothetical protein
MTRHEFLRRLHAIARPSTYLEIGVNDGRSLALSHTTSIAVDPEFKITVPIRCDLHLVKATSDDFFARPDPLAHYRSGRNPLRNMQRGRPLLGHYRGGPPTIDLAFIDGMHHFEFALRDFMNVERHARGSSVIVLDDMLPRDVDEAARDRHTKFWAGDVFKLQLVLRRYRPALITFAVDTAPTGLLVVLGADPTSPVLAEHHDEIVREWVLPDPQTVPTSILERTDAIDPERLLGAEFWPDLLRHRSRGAGMDPKLRQRIVAIAR